MQNRIITTCVFFSVLILSSCEYFLKYNPIEDQEFSETTTKPEKNYAKYCASCHGVKMDAFVDRRWKFGNTDTDLFKAVKTGYPDDGMPSFEQTFNDQEIRELVQYIQNGIKNVSTYNFDTNDSNNRIFKSEKVDFRLDTIVQGIDIPWGLGFLPNGNILITERSGKLYLKNANGDLAEIQETPKVKSRSQGGLLDIEVHPNYSDNGWIYIAYSKPHVSGGSKSTTAIVRGKLVNNKFVSQEEIFEALPYSTRNHHYGVRMRFDEDNYLFFSVGDRGARDKNPQNLNNHCGKIHRLHDDGTIPKDNPFVNIPEAMASIYSYGNRNPQGLAIHPTEKTLWANEHGPRGGDEINIIEKGKNYGWPIASFGINYNGTTFTEKTSAPGLEDPVMYWLPSIGVCGMTFINTDIYGDHWKNNLLSGSLRFKYLERAVLKEDKIIHQEKLLQNIGRLRVVEIGLDGYIYVGVEKPGYIFKLIPE